MKTLRDHWHAWRARPETVHGGNVRDYPLDGRTRDQRREDEMRIMIYLINQQQSYFI